MNLFERIGERMRNKVRSWLRITPATGQSYNIIERTTREAEVMKAQMWYRGDADELFQFFHQASDADGIKGSFWGSVPADGSVRKIHSGLPAIIADTVAYIVKSDMDCIKAPPEWDDMKDEVSKQGFVETVGQAIITALVDGDGAFRIKVTDNEYPQLEFISGLRCEFDDDDSVIICTEYGYNNRSYLLREVYSENRVESHLYDDNDKEISLDTLPELEGLQPVIVFDGDYSLAVPMMFFASPKYAGRGKSIFSGGRSDCFDSLDEVISQWWDAVRQGRVKQYLPESMVPRNPENGSLLPPNSFGNNYITVTAPIVEGVAAKIETVQPEINYDAYASSYMNALLMCLQGIISPATLGIDVGKMSSGEAQREKKDVTGHTRNIVTSVLEQVLPKVIEGLLKTYDNMRSLYPQDREVSVSFGEYGAPDFDSRVETVGKAATYGIMSTQTQVEELWGGSQDDEWKAAEVARIKAEKGILTADEPSVGGGA